MLHKVKFIILCETTANGDMILLSRPWGRILPQESQCNSGWSHKVAHDGCAPCSFIIFLARGICFSSSMVERLSCNQRVVGSVPTGSSRGWVAPSYVRGESGKPSQKMTMATENGFVELASIISLRSRQLTHPRELTI